MFKKVLIANRGAIACRIIRTLRRMGIASVAVYSDADRHAPHVLDAEEAMPLGAAPAADSYLRQDKLLAAARQSGAQAIHPGYGFLSENAGFAAACEAAGIAFIGPTPRQMREFGLKHTARALAERAAVPLLPGSGLLDSVDDARAQAARIGYPLMLKSTAGGGGIGMAVCHDDGELLAAYASVERLARNNFSQGGVFLEKYVARARHVEVQIFGDGRGQVVALGERDCSLQRRNQKVVEETPAPGLAPAVRATMSAAALRLARAVDYRSAGTVEFIYDRDAGDFYFLEVNTRLQVEHGVTEAVTGVDLVEWMVRVAAGESLPPADLQPSGHAIQVRLYAEDPARNFRPSSGLLTEVEFPTDLRVDTWVRSGTAVSTYYDPLLAKLIAHAPTREQALTRLLIGLRQTKLYGIETNLRYVQAVLGDETFWRAEHYTRYLQTLNFDSPTIEVLQPGTHSCIQDYPGRLGFWDVGVPPSGPMDHFAFRLANRILGNAENAAALELTVSGPTLKFASDTAIALTGAHMTAELNDRPLPYWTAVNVRRGDVLNIRQIQGAGQRTYLAVRGGFDVPAYMGSRATFTLGQFGGHQGRALRAGDVLRLHAEPAAIADPEINRAVPAALIPHYGRHWDVAVMYGPHGAPDFFLQADIEMLFSTHWQVHYNSSRTGVRLIGPKPAWARSDGGEAGLHPSNIHDNAYAIGAVDFTGDMPVILGPDGPSLGGFVCPVTIVQAELWKIGQLRPGDTLRFHCIDYEEAAQRERDLDRAIAGLEPLPARSSQKPISAKDATPVLRIADEATQRGASRPVVTYRQAGDKYLLVEYGPQVLDLELRFRVHALMTNLQAKALHGVVDLTPGIRSLQVHYDSRVIKQSALLHVLAQAENELPDIDAMSVPSRIVHLPLSWDDPATQLAIDKYMQSVRADAPWCPSNIEFIRRINGLDSIDEVRRIVFDASYLVMGLGDVYLGAPVATPLDPRHRLVTTKYNPARTWTPENAVGIGGAYLCVYGMEGPGGYQFVGRTVQMWNRYRQTPDFRDGKQWLLRFFDQIRFYPVSAQQLLELREDFVEGRFALRVEHGVLDLGEYRRFLRDHQQAIATFKQRQQSAFEAERRRWAEAGGQGEEVDAIVEVTASADMPEGCSGIAAPLSGSIWQLNVAPGQRVAAESELLVIEAMKMEIPVVADQGGEIVEVRCAQGRAVTAGEILLVVRAT